MELETREEIDAPQAEVWEALTRFKRFERQAERRGAGVVRNRGADGPEWTITAKIGGTPREIALKLTERTPPDRLCFGGSSSGIVGDLVIDLAALTPTITAVTVRVALRGQGFTGKALLQGMKFARGTIQEKFAKRVAGLAAEIARPAA